MSVEALQTDSETVPFLNWSVRCGKLCICVFQLSHIFFSLYCINKFKTLGSL